MEYGGAETHILELSKYLKTGGMEIKIISNGGELFEREISNANIEHITAPFHSRNLLDMRKSRKIIKKIIKSFAPDVVHAHSRIPAFIASGLCKKQKIPLVTTMHYQFKQSWLLKLATKWGDYSLYVSDDIKRYWQKYYDLKEAYLTKTVNGINGELFNNSADTDIRREFDIKPEEKIILTVSRHQIYSSYSAIKLCEIAEDIYAKDKNTRIIIVGDGELFGEIKARADKVNAKLGFNYIIMAGRRSDTHKFCKASALNVGISRSILEAMACEKPVILCGDHGYLGRFSEAVADKCEKTNFTCRGYDYPADINGVLLSEILFCLDPENKDTVKSGILIGADMVRERYGVKKMADDAFSVYKKAVLKYKDYDFVLSGYYGYGNIGDDALLFSVIHNILKKKSDLKICLLTKNPKKWQNRLAGYFCNITAKPRYNFRGVKKAVKKSKAVVFGGGTLLQDSTSSRSFGYYSWILKTAQKFGKKTILYANGIGPVYLKKNQKKAKEVLKNITLATIRDPDSYNYLTGELGAVTDNACLTSDEVLTIGQNGCFDAYKKDFGKHIAKKDNGKSGYIAISVRKWKYVKSDFFAGFAAAVDIICREHGLIPVYILMQPENDRLLSERLSVLNGSAYFADIGGDIEKCLAIVKSAEAVISMRLHTLIFAAIFGIPMIGISYDPKVGSFLKDLYGGDSCTVGLTGFSKNDLTEKFNNLMKNKESAKEKIKNAAKELQKKASENAGLFLKAMEMEAEEDE
jgi:polysaccharide pyruvyl transferase CsaB